MSALAYRKDIDGLRAVAVLAVLLHHFGVPGAPGGYIGVDVFFVISGYLITSLLTADMAAQSFSIVRFYERRIRRIFPALFLMLAASTVLAVVLLLPGDLLQYGKSLLATGVFASNIELWRGIGYFDPGAGVNPLLHTWSLAVEEQFYLLFPLLLWLTRRRPRTTLLLVALVAVLSFAISQSMVADHPNAAFFLTPSRVWELLAGSLLALARPTTWSRHASHAAGLGGLALIFASILLLTPDSRFPGLTALAPCTGALLIIQAGKDPASLAARLLGMRGPVAVGLISYSLYLWHWPVLVFAQYYALDGVGAWAKAGLFAASLALAPLSWRYVEQPWRRRPIAAKRIFLLSTVAVLTTVVVGLAIVASRGAPWLRSTSIQALAADSDRARTVVSCPGVTAPAGALVATCRIGQTSGQESFFVWGDSHASAMAPAFDAAAVSAGRSGVIAARAGCPPLTGASRRGDDACAAFNSAQLRRAMQPSIRQVFLVARWALYAEGTRYGAEGGGQVVLQPAINAPSQIGTASQQLFSASLEYTVAALRGAGKQVVFVHSVPEVAFDVPNAMAKMQVTEVTANIAPTRAAYRARQEAVQTASLALQRRYGMKQIFPHEALCGPVACVVEAAGRPLYLDFHHLSREGASRLTPVLQPFLKTARGDTRPSKG